MRYLAKIIKLIKTESRIVAARAGEKDHGELLFNGFRVSEMQNVRKFWRLFAQQCEYT